ncbi:MAG: RluA family pseudouridine synthase [bacterium]
MEEILFVTEDNFNQRIDKFLADKLNLTRSYIKYLIENNLIKVNDKNIKNSYILKKGDKVFINLKSKNTSYFNSKQQLIEEFQNNRNLIEIFIKNIKVLYEDEKVIIIDKIPIVVNKVSENSFSVIDFLLLKNIDPFIVHRLDRQTTGCLIIAKDYQTALKLSDLFKNRKVIKKYYAIIEGDFIYNSIKIEGDIYHTKNPLKKQIVSYGKNAITIVNKIKSISYTDFLNFIKDKYELEIINDNKNIKKVSILDINIITGRTHQIRVHLSNINYPIVGDIKYGSNLKVFLKLFNEKNNSEYYKNNFNNFYKLETFFLHSYYLKIDNYEVSSKPIWYDLIMK